MKLARCVAVAIALAFEVRSAAAADAPVTVDAFDDISAWTAHPAEGVTLALSRDAGEHGGALRMDVNFTRGTGYAVARRPVSLDLPADYAFRLRMRGEIPTNALEFKLVDSTGNNVWWYVRRDLEFPRTWRTLSTRKRQIRFAWGPAGGGEIRHVAFIEIAVTAGEGGKGTVWLDDLTLEPLAADSTMPLVRARASSGEASLFGDGKTAWRSVPGDSMPWFELDLGRPREFGGLDLRWVPGRHLVDYAVAFSLDGATWTDVDTVRGGNGGRDPLYLPESEARLVRVRALRSVHAPVELIDATIQPLEWSATPEAYFTNLAKDSPRGTYPRPYYGEQCAWAVVGPDGDDEVLLSEDGMLETGKRQFSIEPFLSVDGQLITWADVRVSQSLLSGHWPEPSVYWEHPNATMKITSGADNEKGGEVPLVYKLTNPGTMARRMTLYLAIRPFQVNPPWQNIGLPGGTARVYHVQRDGPIIRVNGDRGVISDYPISAFGALPRDDGDLVMCMRSGQMPAGQGVEDRAGFACGVLAFEVGLGPGQSKTVQLRVPLRPLPSNYTSSRLEFQIPDSIRTMGRVLGAPWVWRHLRRTAELMWMRRAGAPILPGAGREVMETLYAQLGWILVNRDGAAIQPGSRNYDRSWIRDGALTASALLRMGMPTVVREFVEWFAPFQYANGKIPCCASDRGPDPVTENDSHGEFIWLVAEYYRYTGDRGLVARMWPHVSAAVAHMDSLRGERRKAEWRAPEKRRYFGLLMPSISHEGYPNPMHSYWDDFFAYRGYVDAAYLAGVLGLDADQVRISAAREIFAHDLATSIKATMAEKKIRYLPGCAELGDFDATSTTVALSPTDAADLLPDADVRNTFERYWKFFTDRRDGRVEWDAFTPYEVRVIGSFVRLGWRDRANEALNWFMEYRNPPGWRQWAEVAYRDRRAPKYIGDMPHTWVGSDFVRSVLDMFVYERARDSSLVVAAGIPWSWVAHPDSVVMISGTGPIALQAVDLRTTYGPLTYFMRANDEKLTVDVRPGCRVPPGGIIVIPPAPRPFRHATVNGKRVSITHEGGVVIKTLPARTVIVMSP